MSKGDKLKCNVCGMVCVVDELCGCADCDVICCGKPMKKVSKKAEAKKTVRKTVKKTVKKTTKKK